MQSQTKHIPLQLTIKSITNKKDLFLHQPPRPTTWRFLFRPFAEIVSCIFLLRITPSNWHRSTPVVDVFHFAIIPNVTVRCLNVSIQKVKIIYLSSFKQCRNLQKCALKRAKMHKNCSFYCAIQKNFVPLHSISKVFFSPFGATACGRTFQCPTTNYLDLKSRFYNG